MSALFDVVAVNIATRAQRLIAEGKTQKNADAIVVMAVARRGLETEFFKVVPHASPTPRRVQRKRTAGWQMPPNTVCVDRSTPFGNPFPIAKRTSSSMGVTKPIWQIGTWNGPAVWFKDTKAEAADLAVSTFRTWLMHPSQAALKAKARVALRGRNLACWCTLDQPCHADILLEVANETTADSLATPTEPC